MPSDRASFLSPTSPTWPEHQSSARQARQKASRASSSEQSLRLPGLPRFHPANFPSSSNSSMASTPSAPGTNGSEPPISPRSQHRQLSAAQQQLLNYQRELLAAAGRGTWINTAKPKSPMLAPLGSPGPVTPLELEGDNYLLAGSCSSLQANQEYVDDLIRKEIDRSKAELSPRRPTSVGGSC